MKMKGFWVVLVVIALIAMTSQGCKKQAFFASEEAEIFLNADKTSIDLNETVRILITGYNSDGSYLWDGTRIDLTIENGTLNTNTVELEDGMAEVFATGDQERGEMKITARSGNAFADPNPLVIIVGQLPEVNRIVASLSPSILPNAGGRVQIIATVYDSYLQPIPGITVILETNTGTLDSRSAPMISNAAGQVTDYLETTTEATISIYAGDITHSVGISLEEAPQPNTPPVAEFSYSPTDPVSNETIHFNASGSYDEDGDVVFYQWDFGDGSRQNGKIRTHAYDVSEFVSKTFTVTLTVTDDDGDHSTVSIAITVAHK
jgi:hypothetical protein